MSERGAPFIDPRFTYALKASQCIGADSGWDPLDQLDAPAYLKTHSQGEFVFDWMWAQAAEAAGIRWYPKLLVAAPFSPVVGPRLALKDRTGSGISKAVEDIEYLIRDLRLSNAGLNFCDELDREQLSGRRWLERIDWQFHWQNKGYRDFEDFLASLKRKARKNIKAERRKAEEQGWRCRWITGDAITPALIDLAYRCYLSTHQMYGNYAALNHKFFSNIAQTMSEQLLLCVGRLEEQDLACAIFFRDEKRLYGRYWGSLIDTRHVHFEICYYQGIEYCIAHGLSSFEPGAQGEHKIRRGFLPTMTHSYHWLTDDRLYQAISGYLERERGAMLAYRQQLEQLNPYDS